MKPNTFPLRKHQQRLHKADHSRDSAGMTYIYPVISRRAGGVSVGINLNPNNACNWQCIYCQVPNLVRGGPPPIALDQLERELTELLDDLIHGDFMRLRVEPDMQRLVDIAFSGNGEPTSASEFPAAVEIAIAVLERFGLRGKTLLRLITNGSLLDRPRVQAGIARIGLAPVEVWFKLDATTTKEIELINGTKTSLDRVTRRLTRSIELAPTWVQTCVFLRDGQLSVAAGWSQYLELLANVTSGLKGVHLYSLARQSMQNESSRLGQLDVMQMEVLADQIRALGLTVTVNP